MILADLLYDLSQHVLLTDTWLVTLARYYIALVATLVAVLLFRFYFRLHLGNVNGITALGGIGTYVVVAWAQLIAVSSPGNPRDLTALNVGVAVAVTLTFVGMVKAMHINLFRGDR